MPPKGTMAEKIYRHLQEHHGDSLDEIAAAVGLSSRANVLYHMRKLAAKGLVILANGKHRKYSAIINWRE